MTLFDRVDAAIVRNEEIPQRARIQVGYSPIRERVSNIVVLAHEKPEKVELTYEQRKALRRIARGKSIPGRMIADPVISQCFEWSQPFTPPKPIGQMNIIEYCDWEATVRSSYPILNEYGKQLLDSLPVPSVEVAS